MLTTFFLGVLVILTIACFIAARMFRKIGTRRNDQEWLEVVPWARGLGCVLLLFALIIGFFSFTFQVGAKQYGVLTKFGHPTGADYGSGLHWKLPWEKNVTVDGKVQTYGFTTSTKDDAAYTHTYGCIQTTIGNGTPSCVDVSVRWQVAESQASVLYANYGTGDPTDHFGQSVIHAQMLQVIPVVMRTYNPIAQLTVLKGKATGTSVENASFAPDYDALSKQAEATLQERLSGEATIQSVAISAAPLDSATQQKLSQFIQEQAKTRTALQAIETNKNQAKANREIEASLSQSPGLLTSKCLDGVEDAITKGYTLPAGYSCFGSSSVVIPSSEAAK